MNSDLSRRRFLSVGLGGTAAVLALRGNLSASETTSNELQADVCVVGAGYAGLGAALALKKAGKSVIVLEDLADIYRRRHPFR